MISNFFLSFTDKRDKLEYNLKRKPEIIKISILLLMQRLLYLIAIIINYCASN